MKPKRLTDPQILALQFFAWQGLPERLREQAKRPRGVDLKTRNNLIKLGLVQDRGGGEFVLTQQGHQALKNRLGTAAYPRDNVLARFIDEAAREGQQVQQFLQEVEELDERWNNDLKGRP